MSAVATFSSVTFMVNAEIFEEIKGFEWLEHADFIRHELQRMIARNDLPAVLQEGPTEFFWVEFEAMDVGHGDEGRVIREWRSLMDSEVDFIYRAVQRKCAKSNEPR